ncbi:hypothetical protein BU17DRAFT_63727 [Hysterangium stoloniferum]|nr:hypothetical protein BU17DRAFT_63727 [Hysterangium stoloniferum]
MLLCLAPPKPLPTIMFTLSFPALAPGVHFPSAWDAHLQLLVNTRLASPPETHALDRSVAWTALLDSVTFDLGTLIVTCLFIDGTTEEWPLSDRCIRLLETVVEDVNLSVEAEGDADRPKPTPPASPPSPLPSVHKPKKRRSFLATLMASFSNSNSSSSTTPSSLPPPPTLPLPLQPPPPVLTPPGVPPCRFHRRRARSTLVDAYRRFVTSELTARYRSRHARVDKDKSDLPQGGPCYALWVARSTLRSVGEDMGRVLAGAAVEEADASDAGSTTTDGSSVHTPLDSHDAPELSKAAAQQQQQQLTLSPSAFEKYTSLRAAYDGLRSITAQLEDHIVNDSSCLKTDTVSEIKSRRRAWSTKAFLGGSEVGMVGLSTPARRSPLSTVWTPEEQVVQPLMRVQWRRRSLSPPSARDMMPKLNPRRFTAPAVPQRERKVALVMTHEAPVISALRGKYERRENLYNNDDDDEDDEYNGEEDVAKRLSALDISDSNPFESILDANNPFYNKADEYDDFDEAHVHERDDGLYRKRSIDEFILPGQLSAISRRVHAHLVSA